MDWDAAINTDSEHRKKVLGEFYGGFKRNLKLDKLLPIDAIRIGLCAEKKTLKRKQLLTRRFNYFCTVNFSGGFCSYHFICN